MNLGQVLNKLNSPWKFKDGEIQVILNIFSWAGAKIPLVTYQNFYLSERHYNVKFFIPVEGKDLLEIQSKRDVQIRVPSCFLLILDYFYKNFNEV